MDAIKKKMQGMKLEKDNALERALVCEQQARDANLRAEKVSFFSFSSFFLNQILISQSLNRLKMKLVVFKRKSKQLKMIWIKHKKLLCKLMPN